MAEFDLTAEITQVLTQYTGTVMDQVDKAIRDCGRKMREEIAQTSPIRTGAYGKGWRVDQTTNRACSQTRALVYNKTDYQLTHLLEKDRFSRGRTRVIRGNPHIGPAAEKWTAEFVRRCEEACKK